MAALRTFLQREWALFPIALLFCVQAWGSDTSRLIGTVRDSAGALISGVELAVIDPSTGQHYATHTDRSGHFSFPVLPIGVYTLDAAAPGFARYHREHILLDADTARQVEVQLRVGSVSQTVVVQDDSIHTETTSTQLGEVLKASEIQAVPLNGRSFTDLLSLQPGVAPATSITTNSIDDLGAQILSPSGSLNPGTLSVNGQREFANFFLVNGSDVEEDVNAGTAIIPNLDSIAEFRMVTASFDAEYGEFSGAQISVVTRSGTNQLHGSAFEFLRNTALDARNYFSAARGTFEQNQFGGTLGGTLRPDHLFFFTDYQGTRLAQGIDTGNISVPSVQNRAGNLADAAGKLTGKVSGPYLAGLLSSKLGYPVSSGEPYDSPGCTRTDQCVLPNAVIPTRAWSVPAQRLLPYIPSANNGSGSFSTSAFNQSLHDDKGALRLDDTTAFGQFSAYFFLDDYSQNNPYPVAESGASIPGFNAVNTGRAQLLALGLTQPLGSRSVNEVHLSFLRDKNILGQAVGGRGVSLTSQGFTNADGAPSIVALDPQGESVENITFNGFSIGAAADQLAQVNNTWQLSDRFSHVLGTHTLRMGGEFHADQVNDAPIAQFNGSFVFSGTETGDDFADFLIGVPSQFNQSQLNPFYARNKYIGLYAQDSWHPRSSLTLNYGLRWDRVAPWSERYNEISTFVPGEQSVVLPGAPVGLVFPGDPGIPSTLAPVQEANLAPRVGIAWSPVGDTDSVLSHWLGPIGTTTIRASTGEFYTAIDALSIGVLGANAPYGITYTSPAPPLFATPFVSAASGRRYAQPFPFTFAPKGISRRHPDSSIDWSAFEPISGIPAFATSNRTPSTDEWSLSLERQTGPHTVLDATYVGNVSHHQRVLVEANPGNPALCLSLSQPGEVAPGTLTCGPGGEDAVYSAASGGQINGTRGPLGSAFGSNALQSTIGHANYNALELSAPYSTTTLTLSLAHTYGKSLDLASNVGEDVNPIQPEHSYGLSSFDVRHNAALTYSYDVPLPAAFKNNRLTRDFTQNWSVSGITHFASGFPITLIDNTDNSLLGTNPNGVNNSSVDEPDRTGTPLQLQRNPRTGGNRYFTAAAFTPNALGTPGNARRRAFYGPGSDNTDLALSKSLALTDHSAFDLRMEAFNTFNHAQFSGPSTVDGDIGSSTFGQVISAAPPRLMQAAVKFVF
jgi:hypothetical protein